jgi:hypothetical protein
MGKLGKAALLSLGGAGVRFAVEVASRSFLLRRGFSYGSCVSIVNNAFFMCLLLH